GRRRRATSEAALANYDATVASYRQATLDAFQQVEDNLSALRILEQEAEQQQRAVASARESLQLFSNRYKGGVDTYLQVITAQTVTLANERNQVDILRRRIDASLSLVQAVGGGRDVTWSPRSLSDSCLELILNRPPALCVFAQSWSAAGSLGSARDCSRVYFPSGSSIIIFCFRATLWE